MATILLIFAIFFLMGALLTSGKAIGASKVRKELESKKNYEPSETGDAPLACDMLVTRVFEQRMVDAGILEVSEMSVCDNYGTCSDCKPTFVARALKRKQEIMDEQKKKAAESQAKMRELTKGANKRARQGELKLNIEHNGVKQTFDWPLEIPTYASVQVGKGFPHRHYVEVMFKWTATDGKQMAYKAIFPMMEWNGGSTSRPKEASGDLIREAEAPRRSRTYSPMTPERRRAAIAELRKNPPKPPKGRGAGSPIKGNPQTY